MPEGFAMIDLNTALLVWTILGLPAMINITGPLRDWSTRTAFWRYMGACFLAWLAGPLILLTIGILKRPD